MSLKYWPHSFDYAFCCGEGCNRASSCMRAIGLVFAKKAKREWITMIGPDPDNCDLYWDSSEYERKQNELAKD